MFKKDVERYYKKKLREKEIKDELKELKDLLISQLGDKEVEVKDSTDTTVGINIVSRCNNCGKIRIKFVATNADYLVDSRGVRTGK